MAAVAAKLEAIGFFVERNTRPGIDCYNIRPFGSDFPVWVVMRQYDGFYQLQNGDLDILKEGRALKDVLHPGWLP